MRHYVLDASVTLKWFFTDREMNILLNLLLKKRYML